MADFVHASTEAFASASVSVTAPVGEVPRSVVEAPWTDLRAMAKVLALPTEDADAAGGVTFAQAMAAAWSDGESLGVFYERMGMDMDRAQLHAVLRRRVECWR